MSQTRAAILATLAAPLVPAFLGALITPLRGGTINTDLTSVLGLTVVVYPFALVLGSIVGLPLLLVFRRYHLAGWWSAALSGAIAGAFWVGVITLRFDLRNSVLVGIEGALAGLTFWAIWRLHGVRAESANRDEALSDPGHHDG